MATSAYGQPERFPFLAQAVSNGVHVRAGQNAAFESLCRIDTNTRLIVVGKEYSWYKVQLPAAAKSYISSRYVRILQGTEAQVSADKVNVRAGTHTNAAIIGTLRQGETVHIIKDEGQWYQIEPVTGSFGWVAAELVSFLSADISTYRDTTNESPVTVFPEIISPVVPAPPINSGVLVLTGRLAPVDDAVRAVAAYQLLINGTPAYYIKSPQHIYDRFINYTVSVEGVLLPESDRADGCPVVTVTTVAVVL